MTTLKTRLFGKSKKKSSEGERILSQSASDISHGKEAALDPEENLSTNLGSRALSHDSIFLADLCSSSTETPRGLSQENVSSRIKSLQTKLQQQNLRLGQPPLLLTAKKPEDTGCSSEDDGLPQSPPEIILHEVLPQRVHGKPKSPTILVPPVSSDGGVDFNTPAQYIPCLDTSAARHRMSVKPRNQRASAKVRKLTPQDEPRPRSESLNNFEYSTPERDDDKGLIVSKEPVRFRSHSTQVFRSGDHPEAHSLGTHRPVTARRSLMEPSISLASPSPCPTQPQTKTHPITSDNAGPRLTARSQPPVAKVQEPLRAPGYTSAAPTAAPMMLQADDLKLNPQASEPTASPKFKTRQIGESLGIYALQPAQPSGTVPANKEKTDKGPQIPEPQKSNEAIKRKPAVEAQVQPKAQPTASVPGDSSSLASDGTQRKLVVKDGHKGDAEPDKRTPLAKVPQSKQEEKPQAKVNVTPGQQRPSSGSPLFTISPATNREQRRTGSFTGRTEETGIGKDFSKTIVPPKPTQRPEDQHDAQREVKAKDQPAALPAQTLMKATENQRQKPSPAGPAPSAEVGEEAKEEEDGIQEAVEVAEEAGEDLKEKGGPGLDNDNGTFGVKLRSTSLSLKYKLDKAQAEADLKQRSATVSRPGGTQGSPAAPLDSAGRKDIASSGPRGITTGSINKHAANLNPEPSPTSSARQNISALTSTGIDANRIQLRASSQEGSSTKSSSALPPSKMAPPPEPNDVSPEQPNAKEAETSGLDFSWMSMAMEKTKSIQQMITSKLPEFPEGSVTLLGNKEPSSTPTTDEASIRKAPGLSSTKQTCCPPVPIKEAETPSSVEAAPSSGTGKEPDTEVSWMSMAMEKTKTIQQLFSTSPHTASKPPAPAETQPQVVKPVVPSGSDKTPVQQGQTPKLTASADIAVAETSLPRTGQSFRKPAVAVESGPKQGVTTSSPSSATQPNVRGTRLGGGPSADTQPSSLSRQIGKPSQAQPQQVPFQSGVPSSLTGNSQPAPALSSSPKPAMFINKVQPSTPLSISQTTPRTPQSTAGAATTAPYTLSSSPKVPLLSKQHAAPTTQSCTAQPDLAMKRENGSPQGVPEKGKGANVSEEWEPRASVAETKAAFLEKWGDKGGSTGNKIEASRIHSATECVTSFRTGAMISESSTDAVPNPVPLRPVGREDRLLKRTPGSVSSTQQAPAEAAQPSWMEMAKRKSMAWSDKSMD